jgi:hypothetical protein
MRSKRWFLIAVAEFFVIVLLIIAFLLTTFAHWWRKIPATVAVNEDRLTCVSVYGSPNHHTYLIRFHKGCAGLPYEELFMYESLSGTVGMPGRANEVFLPGFMFLKDFDSYMGVNLADFAKTETRPEVQSLANGVDFNSANVHDAPRLVSVRW